MACGCSKNKAKYLKDPSDVMGGYKYLKPSQVAARLEIFKRKYCTDCESRYKCDYNKYVSCKGSEQKPSMK